MVVDELVQRPGSWLASAKGTGVVISSRVRLARNLVNHAFPGWAGEDECRRVCDKIVSVCEPLASSDGGVFLDMATLSNVDRDVLCERHLISTELAGKGAGSGVVVADGEQVAIMINEEDHLRLQAIAPGMRLQEVWHKLDAIDSDIESRLQYAFSAELGYLTACPSNVGTGLRASVMLHLSGLKLTEDIDPVLKGLDRMGLAVRGLLGEGTEAFGNMFQISNQSTLGETEEEIVERLVKVVEEVVGHEQNARARLMERRPAYVHDQVGRAFGILTHARVLSSKEAIDLLSGLRLGVEMGLVGKLDMGAINEIMVLTQPGHLQKMAGQTLGPEERDEMRSKLVRQRLQNVVIEG